MDQIDRIISATTRTIADALTVVVLLLSVQKEHDIRAIDINNTHCTIPNLFFDSFVYSFHIIYG